MLLQQKEVSSYKMKNSCLILFTCIFNTSFALINFDPQGYGSIQIPSNSFLPAFNFELKDETDELARACCTVGLCEEFYERRPIVRFLRPYRPPRRG